MRVVVLLLISMFLPFSFVQSETRILSLEVFDSGDTNSSGLGAPQIDLSRDTCSVEGEDEVLEPFYDTIVGIEVVNDAISDIRFNRAWFKVASVDGTRRSFATQKLALISDGRVPSGETKVLLAFMARADDDQKVLDGKRQSIAPSGGFKKVTAHLSGRFGKGKIRLKGRSTFAFGNYDRCN